MSAAVLFKLTKVSVMYHFHTRTEKILFLDLFWTLPHSRKKLFPEKYAQVCAFVCLRGYACIHSQLSLATSQVTAYETAVSGPAAWPSD